MRSLMKKDPRSPSNLLHPTRVAPLAGVFYHFTLPFSSKEANSRMTNANACERSGPGGHFTLFLKQRTYLRRGADGEVGPL